MSERYEKVARITVQSPSGAWAFFAVSDKGAESIPMPEDWKAPGEDSVEPRDSPDGVSAELARSLLYEGYEENHRSMVRLFFEINHRLRSAPDPRPRVLRNVRRVPT